MRFKGFVCCWVLLCLFSVAHASVPLANYGMTSLQDSVAFKQAVNADVDSMCGICLNGKYLVSDIEVFAKQNVRTSDFYLLLLLCLMLGGIRFMDSQYFLNLWRAFLNPILSSRQLKDQLQREKLPNLLMNIFFTIAEGAYLYYIVRYFTPYHSGNIAASFLIIMLIFGTAFIYVCKYLAIRFSGWAFKVEGITDQYLFNVFLVNKILGMSLVPFIIILAFADHSFASGFVTISFIIAGAMILNRYIRSWQALGSFFQFSKFHFFMYLCTSELLPLSVLIKLLIKGLML